MATDLLTGHRRDGAAPVAGGRATRGFGRGAWPALGALGVVLALLLSFAAHGAAYLPGDVASSRTIQALDIAWLALPLRGLNALGFPPFVGLAYGAILVLLFRSGSRWEAAVGTFGVLGGAGINFLVKTIVDRPRPDAALIHVEHQIASAGRAMGGTARWPCVAWRSPHA